jgi:glyoxylase-like metal-dependent hydrolase (beta-lactamase superfamily II)
VSTPAGLHATPAELPLAGGRADATLKLHPLLCAEMRGPTAWFHRVDGPTAALKALGIGASSEQQLRVPIVAFLLEHPTAGLVLVDTGFHRSIADGGGGERARNLGPIGRLIARDVRMRPDQTVLEQLRARGIEPADVGLVVMTHLHFDHASALSDFPGATVLLAEHAGTPRADARRSCVATRSASSTPGRATARWISRPWKPVREALLLGRWTCSETDRSRSWRRPGTAPDTSRSSSASASGRRSSPATRSTR